jgi:hypothetical protein
MQVATVDRELPRPTSLVRMFHEVADELRRTFSERKGWLLGLGLNVVVAAVYVGYKHYQPHSHDKVRIAGIATDTVAWVLASVINTNQLGADEEQVTRSLRRGEHIGHELALKNLALGILLFPIAFALSVGVRLALDHWREIPHAILFDLYVTFLWLGVGSLVSVLLPYRPISLRQRWQRRSSWFRWGVCLAAPYVVLFAIIRPLKWPADRLARALCGAPEQHLLGYAFVYFCFGVAVWLVCLCLAGLYGRIASERLQADLERED